MKNTDQTYWVPSNIKEGRFNNWLANARDWNISRSRYWGTPIPLWASDDFEEVYLKKDLTLPITLDYRNILNSATPGAYWRFFNY